MRINPNYMQEIVFVQGPIYCLIPSATVLFPEKLKLSKNKKQHISFACDGGKLFFWALRVYFISKGLLD